MASNKAAGKPRTQNPAPRKAPFDRAIDGLFLAIVFAAGITWATHEVPNLPVTQWGVDLVMAVNAGASPKGIRTERFVFIDVDDASCRVRRQRDSQACEPSSPALRRDMVSALEVAQRSGARAVILDFDLSFPSAEDVAPRRASVTADVLLQDALGRARIPVFIPRPIRVSQGSSGRTDLYFRSTTVVDRVANPLVQFGHVLWQPEFDRLLRRPILCLPITDASGVRGEEQEASLGYVAAARLAPSGRMPAKLCPARKWGGFYPRVIFSMPQYVPGWRAMVAWTSGEQVASIPRIQLSQLRAGVSPDPFKGAIVVMGSSRRDGGDLHLTPIGELAGPEVIANQINSHINHRPLVWEGGVGPYWKKLKIALLFAVVVWVFWSIMDRVPGRLKGRPEGPRRPLDVAYAATRPILIVALYAALVVSSAAAIVAVTLVGAGPEMVRGIAVDPLTPAVALLFETALEAVKFLLNGLHELRRWLTKPWSWAALALQPRMEWLLTQMAARVAAASAAARRKRAPIAVSKRQKPSVAGQEKPPPAPQRPKARSSGSHKSELRPAERSRPPRGATPSRRGRPKRPSQAEE